ncbi:DUF4124 domain-containing protein [Novilysobacter erysipheiresistens]|uniref:DUF4124 domain-containing protein n=1 Tax=Novilysobacter erysipheiresistens TaxID=1749332 RepID=A0ABU7YXB0_9GAMM
MSRARAASALGLMLATVSAPGLAQQSVVIYRCTDASGAVTVQNDVACPKGSQQQRRVIETEAPPYTPPAPPAAPAEPAPLVAVVPMPAPSVIEPPPADATVDLPPPIPLAERTAPPPLFACKTWNREEYLSDDPVPAERCAPMQTTGLGGDPAMGAGAACMMVTDFCQPVPEAALCERWRDHLMRAEAIVEFDRARDPVAAKTELQRLRTIVSHSTCS